jgi:hypothetical protein
MTKLLRFDCEFFSTNSSKKEETEKNATRVECMNKLINFLRRINQKIKKKVSLILINHLFVLYSSILMIWFICIILIIDVFLLIFYDDVYIDLNASKNWIISNDKKLHSTKHQNQWFRLSMKNDTKLFHDDWRIQKTSVWLQ